MEMFNAWAILAATVMAFVLGGLWYGPLFGQAWLNAMGKTEEDLEPSVTPFVVSFFTSLLTALTLAWLIHALSIVTWVAGALLGLAIGIGFIATSMASDSAFCRWGSKLFFILAGYRVTYVVLMGALLGGWQ